jgi:hypothetical protein
MLCVSKQSRPQLGVIQKQIEIARSTALLAGRAGQGLQLHANPLEQTHALPGISEIGVEQ